MPSGNKKLSPNQTLQFIRDWSEWFYAKSPSFRGSLGCQLAYLWPAITNGNQIEVSSRSSIVQLLKREGIKPTDRIWKYIDVVG